MRCFAQMRALITLAALCVPATGCVYFDGDSHVFFTSEPAGARVYIDGTDTGETTPVSLDMGGLLGGAFNGDFEVTIRKRGFEPESRRVYHHTIAYTSKWVDGVTTFWMFSFPLFWTFGDFFLPFGMHWDYVPHEVHVQLYPVGEAPGMRSAEVEKTEANQAP